MGRKKQSLDCEECSRLEQEVKELRSLTKLLRKRLRKVSKDAASQEEALEEESNVILVESPRIPCPKCKHGSLQQMELKSINEMYHKCDTCLYRSKSKPCQKKKTKKNP